MFSEFTGNVTFHSFGVISKLTMNLQPKDSGGDFSSRPRWRKVLHEVISEADTQAGKAFDVFS